MKKLIYLFVGVAFLVSSCTITQRTSRIANLNVQVNLDMDDLEYIGEVTGSADQHYLFGLPFGGRRFYSGAVTHNGLPGLGGSLDRGFSNALYDALLSKPDADFVLPTSTEVKIQRAFLGSTKKFSIKGKAYRIKTK